MERPGNGKSFKELVEKIIPGGGKTKVILPIIAEQKANGTNLLLLKFPQALLENNLCRSKSYLTAVIWQSAHRFGLAEIVIVPQHS